jgi:HK97 family phage portal protein
MSPVFQTLGELGAWYSAQPSPPGLYVVDPGIPLTTYSSPIDGIWSSQPSVRKVVDFIARNVASTPLHAYERVSDADRQRLDPEHPLSQVLAQPSPNIPGEPAAVTAYRFWHMLLVDWLMFDRWAAMKLEIGGQLKLQRFPARSFNLMIDHLDRVVAVRFWDANGRSQDLDPARFVWDSGYTDPANKYQSPGTAGTSPMATIQAILQEAAEAVAFRRSVWANGARIPAVILRDRPWPADGKARENFKASWQAFVKGGNKEGGTPILEDGMKLDTIDAFKPQDTGDLEGRKLTDQEVASFYHIAPELVGAREGNYSNMDAFRQGLYRESLGPYIWEFTAAINLWLTPELSDGKNLYVEADLDAKLAGSFQEQAQVLQTAVGAPWLLRSEARARFNLPEISGTDQLVVPLNVLVGGQASPTDSGSQNVSSGRPELKARATVKPPSTYVAKLHQVLVDYYRRQRTVVKSQIKGKAKAEWWDEARWNKELTQDLLPAAYLLATQAGRSTFEQLGIPEDEYDADRTLNFLSTMSNNNAKKMNATTYDQIEEALLEEDWESAYDEVYDEAEGWRSDNAAGVLATSLAAWGALEAGRQAGGGTQKIWITGPNPRPSHAEMDGEMVPIDEPFSNGSDWPADGMDGEYGCNCSLEIYRP